MLFARQVMVANIRCAEIGEDQLKAFLGDQAWLALVSESSAGVVLDFGDRATKLLQSCLSGSCLLTLCMRGYCSLFVTLYGATPQWLAQSTMTAAMLVNTVLPLRWQTL